MNLRNFPKSLLLIFFIALILRTLYLDKYPAGFQADEVRAGWNAFSIMRTLHDDRGNLFAMYYNTFGDYRPTGIFYITIPSIFFLGLNEFAVRFPSALIGALTVFPLYFLSVEVFNKHKAKNMIALFSGFFLSISPWHILTSRSSSEVVISVFFTLVSLLNLIYAFKNKSAKYYIFSFITIIISYGFYHTIRLLAPLLVGAIIIYYWPTLRFDNKKISLVYFFLTILVSLALLTNKASVGRFSQVTIGTDVDSKQLFNNLDKYSINNKLFDNKYVVFGQTAIAQYMNYFNAGFLIGNDSKPIRYRTPNIGVLTNFEFVLLLIGIVLLIRNRNYNLVLILLFISPLASALTTEDSPNLHRSMYMIVFIAMIMGYAVANLWTRRILSKCLLIIILIGLIFNFDYFILSYRTRSLSYLAPVRHYAYKELSLYLNEVSETYDKVFITNDPDDPYPWLAFYNKFDPKEFNQYAIKRSEGTWRYNNLIFTQKECPSGDVFPGPKDKTLDENILVIDSFKCPVESKIHDGMKAKVIKQIKYPSGDIAFTIWEKND